MGSLSVVGKDAQDRALSISGNEDLVNLDALTGIWLNDGGAVKANSNPSLPDCEVCELLDQIASDPSDIYVSGNLWDGCTPVPYDCP